VTVNMKLFNTSYRLLSKQVFLQRPIPQKSMVPLVYQSRYTPLSDLKEVAKVKPNLTCQEIDILRPLGDQNSPINR
jgi:hypothetical protein